MSDPIVIVSMCRTPMGAMLGSLKNVYVSNLGAIAISGCFDKINHKVSKDRICQVIMGNVLSAGVGQSPARQAAIFAGLADKTPCTNINKVCGSGMYAVMAARNSLLLDECEFVIAGGMESMTNAPYILKKARAGYRYGNEQIIDHVAYDGLTDVFSNSIMGILAEKAAEEYSITREEQDTYAKKSYEKVFAAYEKNAFAEEIVPVKINDKKGELVISKDEPPFAVNLEKLSSLKPAFKTNGTITAGSSSSIADGAAALLLCRESVAIKNGLTPIARIVGQSCYAHNPNLFATAPINTIKNVLEKSNWNIDDVDLFEINEAFAVVTLSAMKECNIPEEKVNIYGGACALGHPLGASGARIIVTLLNAMKNTGKKRGLATLCVGGGEGTAMTFEMY